MRKYPKALGCVCIVYSLILLNSCNIVFTDNTSQENKDNSEITKPDNNGNEIKPDIPPVNPNDENYVEGEGAGIRPFPNDITDDKVLKARLPDTLDNRYMYLMVRFKGVSERGLWKQGENVYPRGFVLGYTDINTNQYAEAHLNGYDNSLEPIPGVGYMTETGFSNEIGSWLITNFFYGNEHIRTPIYGNSDIIFKFRNFVIWDTLDDGIGFMGHPAFVRLNEQHPLKIIVPMKDYDPDIHKNIAYITVYFELDKGTADNPYPYQAVFDGFQPK